LVRLLAVVDVETTGLDPVNDRIVQIDILRVEPDGWSDLPSNPNVRLANRSCRLHPAGGPFPILWILTAITPK
jgi:DNA polymerase III epsilon subunit-like protein